MDLNLPGSGRTIAQTFSVFDYDTGRYRYFNAPIAALPLTGHYRAPRNKTPEGLAATLPLNAQQVGEGDDPKGVVAAASGISGLGETTQVAPTQMLAYAAGIGLALFLVSRALR